MTTSGEGAEWVETIPGTPPGPLYQPAPSSQGDPAPQGSWRVHHGTSDGSGNKMGQYGIIWFTIIFSGLVLTRGPLYFLRLFEIDTGFKPGFLEISGKMSIGDVILRSCFSISKYRTFCFIILRYFSKKSNRPENRGDLLPYIYFSRITWCRQPGSNRYAFEGEGF